MALVDGFRPAMLVARLLLLLAALVTAVFVSDGPAPVPRLSPPPPPTAALPVPRPLIRRPHPPATRHRSAIHRCHARTPELQGQTVVVLGGNAEIGPETARRARAEGAEVVLTGRKRGRLNQAAQELDAARTAAFDATDPATVERFFADLPFPMDHVFVSGRRPPLRSAPGARPRPDARRHLSITSFLPLAGRAPRRGKVPPRGSLTFIGGTGPPRPRPGLAVASRDGPRADPR